MGRTGDELDDDRKGEPEVGKGEPGECEVESTRVSGGRCNYTTWQAHKLYYGKVSGLNSTTAWPEEPTRAWRWKKNILHLVSRCRLLVLYVPTGLDHDCSDTVGRSGSTSTGPISPLPSIATHDGRCKGAVGPPPPLADQFGGLLRHVGLGFAWLDVAQCPFIASFRHKLKA
jgi:hypothetical protein